MQGTLAAFLAAHEPSAHDTAVWAGGALSLQIACYLGAEAPPLDAVTSVRCLVFRDGAVLVVRERVDCHILPGGRREPGETLEQTARREVLEETGWSLGALVPLGFLYFRPTSDARLGHSSSSPDFIHRVYMAEAEHFDSGALQPDGNELGAEFRPLTEVASLELTADQHCLLAAATARRGHGPAAPHSTV